MLCISYPKSGRTWLRVMLDELGVPLDFSHLDTGAGRQEWGKHFDELETPSAEGKVIFLHRDPRDTVVSFFHEMTKRQKPSFNRRLRYALQGKLPPREMAAFVRSPRFGIEKVIRFNLACAENLDAHCVSYEKLREKPVECLSGMLAYLGYAKPAHEIAAAVDRNSFARMKEREAKGVYSSSRLRPRDPNDPDSFKVRKGKIGGWREEMDPGTQAYSNALLERYRYTELLADLIARKSKQFA